MSVASRDAKRRSRAERRAAGLCPECGRFPPAEGRARCEDCLAIASSGARRRRGERRAESVCPVCGEGPLERWNFCLTCRRRQADTARKSAAAVRKHRKEDDDGSGE